ncbi:MAG: hypothetical protein DMF89_13955 [Acidobacteria bacterium]|nr:MAG: hypothetical protein DMF89_13955 [Acidobacteriota bacterium]
MSATWEGGALHIRLSPARLVELGYWVVALSCGAVQAWVFRNQPSTVDAISYLDIGDMYAQGHWRDALNGCWNPLYSWVLGVVMAIVQPTPRMEYPTAKAVDYAIFVGALFAFRWFLKAFMAAYHRSAAEVPGRYALIPEIAWVSIGYTIFVWSSLVWIRVTSSTPDMAGAALTYIAWGLLYRLRERPRMVTSLALGAALALGYYTRTPMLVVGVLLLGLLAVQGGAGVRRAALAAALVFAVLTLPFVVSLSLAHRHVTIGDNGALNHAWLANPGEYVIPDTNWQGGPAGFGAPRHPTRLIWSALPTFEFASPIGGTYPPWTDPSYWYEGLTYRFDAAAEWKTLSDNLRFYWLLFGRWLILGAGIALLVAGDGRASLRTVAAEAPSWLPVAFGLALHAVASNLFVQWLPAQPLSRYVGAFGALFCLMAIACLRFRPRAWSGLMRLGLGAGPAVAGLAVLALLVSEHLVEARDGMERRVAGREARLYAPWPPWDVAERLQRTGLVRPGSRVAIVGEKSRHEYWARLARVQIIAQVPEDLEFWRKSAEERALMLKVLARTGADAVVSSRIPMSGTPNDWVVVDGTNYAVRRLLDVGEALPPRR